MLPLETRYQYYPENLRHVFIDREERPWFHIHIHREKRPSLHQVRYEVEQAYIKDLPWVSNSRILYQDRQNRMWVRPSRTLNQLHVFDPDIGRWTILHFEGRADDRIFETTDGRIFASGDGMVTVVSDKWRRRELVMYGRNQRERDPSDRRAYAKPNYTEGPGGLVYIWSSDEGSASTPTRGYYIHNGETFRQVAEVKENRLNHLGAVLPLDDGRVLVCPWQSTVLVEGGPEKVPPTEQQIRTFLSGLGADTYEKREQAEQNLRDHLRAAAPILREQCESLSDPEVLLRINRLLSLLPPKEQEKKFEHLVDDRILKHVRLLHRDRERNYWIYAAAEDPHTGETTDMRVWKITPQGRVFFTPIDFYPESIHEDKDGGMLLGRSGMGVHHWNGETVEPVTDWRMSEHLWILGRDKAGRLFTKSGRNRFLSIRSGAEDNRPGLDIDVWDSANALVIDSEGTPWAKFANRPESLISEFRDETWIDWPLPENAPHVDRFVFVSRLGRRRLLLISMNGVAFYFNGTSWSMHENVTSLVEDQFRELRTYLDNRHIGSNFRYRLATDSRGRVWLMERESCKVYTGKKWVEIGESLKEKFEKWDRIILSIPFGDRGHMLIADRKHLAVVKIGFWGLSIEEVPSFGRIEERVHVKAWKDSKNRIWVPLDSGHCGLMTTDGTRVFEDLGIPLREDHHGNIWFAGRKHGVVVLHPETGDTLTVPVHNTFFYEQLVIPEPGHIWATTIDGWMRIRFAYEEDHSLPALLSTTHYTRNPPPANFARLFQSPKPDTVWALRVSSDMSRVFRVRLPADEHPSDN